MGERSNRDEKWAKAQAASAAEEEALDKALKDLGNAIGPKSKGGS